MIPASVLSLNNLEKKFWIFTNAAQVKDHSMKEKPFKKGLRDDKTIKSLKNKVCTFSRRNLESSVCLFCFSLI